jgi:hypothetical protein
MIGLLCLFGGWVLLLATILLMWWDAWRDRDWSLLGAVTLLLLSVLGGTLGWFPTIR